MTRFILACFISAVPLNFVRVLLYRWILKYDIDKSARIGLFTVIAVSEVSIKKSKLGFFNRFTGPFTLNVGENAIVGSFNVFNCGSWTLEERFAGRFPRKCTIHDNCLITTHHYFDVVGEFELNKNAWIGGRESQFWTHGNEGANDTAVSIGENCYIGSAVRFAPGASIAKDCVVALGSIVTHKIQTSNALIGGMPAKVIKENYNRAVEVRN